jgi:hypothetical protein
MPLTGGAHAGAYNQTGALPQPADTLVGLNGSLWDAALQPFFYPMVASGLFSARRWAPARGPPQAAPCQAH